MSKISNDRERIEKYWNTFVEAWFEKGKEDPNMRLLQVKVSDAHYWDTKTNKLVSFLKLATTALSGERMDIGREGDLDI